MGRAVWLDRLTGRVVATATPSFVLSCRRGGLPHRLSHPSRPAPLGIVGAEQSPVVDALAALLGDARPAGFEDRWCAAKFSLYRLALSL